MTSWLNTIISGRTTVFKNFFALGILQGTNFLIPIIIMPYLISTVGIEGYGIISFIQAVMIYFYSITDYGFAITATRQIALNHTNKKNLSEIFNTVLFTKLFLTIIAAFIITLLVLFIPKFNDEQLAFFYGFSIVIGQSILPTWFFQGVERMKFITYINLSAKILFTILIFVFIKEKNDYPLVLLFFGIGNFVSGVVGVFYAKKLYEIKWAFPSFSAVIEELKMGWRLFLANFSVVVYMNSNLFILGLFTTNTVTGYYSVAEKIIMGLRQILSIFSQAIYPHICQLTEKGLQSLIKFYKEVFIPFLVLVIILCILVFAFASPIISVLAEEANEKIISLLKWLTVVPIIVAINIPVYQTLLGYSYTKSYTKVAIAGSILNVIINIILADSYGAFGTVYSVIITELFITIGLYYIFYSKHKPYLK